MSVCACATIMAAATLRDLCCSCAASHASVAFFFVLFSFEKSFVEAGDKEEDLTDFLTLKTVWCSRRVHRFYET